MNVDSNCRKRKNVRTSTTVLGAEPGAYTLSDSEHGRRLPVIGFLAGTGISLLGNTMAMLAIPWFVLDITGSASRTGFAGVAIALPMALSGVFGGPMIDRFGGRRMSIIADVVSALSIAAIPLLYRLDLLTYPLLLVLIFLGAMLDIPGVTARRMLLPGFQKQAGLRAEQMNTAFEVLSNVAIMIGPAIAGVLIALMGPVNLLWMTTAGFLISAIGVLFLAPTHEVGEVSSRKQPYLESIQEGFAFIVKTRVLLAMAMMFAVSNFISNGFFSVGLPVFVYETWGNAARLGIIFSALGVGQLAGAVLYGSFGHRVRQYRRLILITGFASQPIWYAAFLWSDSVLFLMVAAFMMGFMAGPANPMAVTVRFEHIPKALHGRVFGTFSAITAAISPLGIAASGVLIERYGIQRGLEVIVIAYLIFALVLPFVSAFADMNQPGPYEGESAN